MTWQFIVTVDPTIIFVIYFLRYRVTQLMRVTRFIRMTLMIRVSRMNRVSRSPVAIQPVPADHLVRVICM